MNFHYSMVFLVKKSCDISLISFKDIDKDMKKILQEIGKNSV